MFKYTKRILIGSILCISIIFIGIISLKDINEGIKKESASDDSNIIYYIKQSLENNEISTEENEKFSEYLLQKNDNSEYYFVKGYLDYMNYDYEKATESFEIASKKISNSDSSVIKIYTYILLNESVENDDNNEFLVNNCKNALKYISMEKDYKNDVNLLWRTISVLLNDESNIEESINLLIDYLNNTNGLENESIVKLKANIGQLYTLVYKYSDAVYNYLDTINLIESKKNIENGEYYRIKLLTAIGDVNFSLSEYQNAIEYYDEALSINLNDKNMEALSKSITIINKYQCYIELKEYERAAEINDELNYLLDYLDDDIKDDISILKNHILAQVNICEHNFEEAQRLLTESLEILEQDTYEFSLNKDIFINLDYAQLYGEQKLYEKSLLIYEDVLKESINRGLGLEEEIYWKISEIYKEKQDLNNYIKYNELYINKKNDNTHIFKEDYMKYTTSIYESDLLKEKSDKDRLNLIIMIFTLIILSIIIFSKTKSVKKLRYSNFTDSMTGLYNRKYLDHYINNNKKKLLLKPISVIIIDIDYFKKYNDNYGHIEGDKIIQEVAFTLKESVRKEDVTVRYGGEEMVLIIPDVSINITENIVKKIQENLRNKNIEHKYSEIDNILTISIGIYNTKFSGQDIYSLINKADMALYNAKKGGRNRYDILYDEEQL